VALPLVLWGPGASVAFSYGDRGDLCLPHVLVSDPGVVHPCCVVLATQVWFALSFFVICVV